MLNPLASRLYPLSLLLAGAAPVLAQTETGSGCPGFAGVVPGLTLRSDVRQGLPALADVVGVPGTAGLLLGSLNNTGYLGLPLPLDLGTLAPGLAGCTLYQAPAVQLPFALDADGGAVVSLGGWPAGLTAYFQVWNLDFDLTGLGSLGGFSPGYSEVSGVPGDVLFPGTLYPVGLEPRAVATADFNGDGLDDFAVANRESDDVSVILSTGAKGLAPELRVPVGDAPWDVLALDVSGDGVPDLVTSSNFSDAVHVALGNGDGSFAPGIHYGYVADSEPRGLAAGDVNGDGIIDLAVANSRSDDVSVLLGQGGGGFAGALRIPVEIRPEVLAVGDVDGDGLADLAVAHEVGNRISVLAGNGDGSFAAALELHCGSVPKAIAVGDLDGDGQLDVVSGNSNSQDLSVFYRGPGGSFEAEQRIDLDLPVCDLACEDLDLDGRLDLAVAYGVATYSFEQSGRIDVLFGSAGGGLEPPRSHFAGQGKAVCALGDVDGDGHRDLVAALPAVDGAAVLWGRRGRGFLARHTGTLGQSRHPHAFELGDLDNDGVLEMVVSTRSTLFASSGVLTVYRDLGDTEFGSVQVRSAGAEPAGLALGDVDEDGILDVVLADSESGSVRVYRGNGAGGVAFFPDFVLPGLLGDEIELADLDQDGHLDLVIGPSIPQPTAQVHLGAGDGSFGPKLDDPALVQVFPLTLPASAMLVEDFDLDGHLDLLLAMEYSSTSFENVARLRGRGDGTFESAELYLAAGRPRSLAAGDLNSDGLTDLVVGGSDSEDASVFLGLGTGSLAPVQHVPTGGEIASVSLADVDLDGDLDLFAPSTGFDDPLPLLRGQGDGSFGTAELLDQGDQTYCRSGGFGDLDGDGAPEAVGIAWKGVFSFPNGLLE